MRLSDTEFRSILEDETKQIPENITWKEDEDHSPAWEFRIDVESTNGWPLFVQGRYNPVARTLNYTLILKTTGCIYALDLGKDHHNPEGKRVGETHKHTWSERDRDKRAYAPRDVKASVSDPVSVWKEFCAEARIRHQGAMQPPPPRQEELWS